MEKRLRGEERSNETPRVLDRDLEKTVRKLRDRAVVGEREAKGDARDHYGRAAEELSLALGESVRDAKRVDYDRPGKRLRRSDDLEEARNEARKLLEKADRRRRDGNDEEAARIVKTASHLAAGLREFSAARIADSLHQQD